MQTQNPTDDDPNTPPAAGAALPLPVEEASSAADAKAAFTVTPRAGPRVAGMAVKPQQKIRLTEAEAQSELLAGSIVRDGTKLHEQLLASAKPRASKAA